MHRKKDYPYVGYGHKLRPGETYSSNMSRAETELLLRKDLKEYCGMFSCYGKDSMLLAALAYNVGPYRILGSKKKYPKSTLLKKIEAGIRDFKEDYVQFCHWKEKKYRLSSEDGMQSLCSCMSDDVEIGKELTLRGKLVGLILYVDKSEFRGRSSGAAGVRRAA